MTERILGLDVGGANLKAATPEGRVASRPFALWKNPAGLADALADAAAGLGPFDRLAVTMTGEVCDCFAARRDGVAAVLAAVGRLAGDRPVGVWSTAGRFLPPAAASANPLAVASANWHALARLAGRHAPRGRAILVDIGSTTADLIPLRDGAPVPRGLTDADRLRSGELVYTGVRRTPVCALVGSRVCAEWFATSLDAYLLLGELGEDEADANTADGRPATAAWAHVRMARVLGGDGDGVSRRRTYALASAVRERQLELLRDAWGAVAVRLGGPPEVAVLSGAGEFLARAALPEGVAAVSLAERLGEGVSAAACAYAVAVLASERTAAVPAVVKVGGSLYDLPDLGPRVAGWLRQFAPARVLLVPGGGAAADVVRTWDRAGGLSESAAHWLALRSLSLSAHLLAHRIPGASVVTGWDECADVWADGGVPVLDGHAFALADEGRPGALPHSWEATSDALAARVAAVGGAGRLVLLKSADPPGDGWEAGRGGYIDPLCARVAAAAGLRVEAVNLRRV